MRKRVIETLWITISAIFLSGCSEAFSMKDRALLGMSEVGEMVMSKL